MKVAQLTCGGANTRLPWMGDWSLSEVLTGQVHNSVGFTLPPEHPAEIPTLRTRKRKVTQEKQLSRVDEMGMTWHLPQSSCLCFCSLTAQHQRGALAWGTAAGVQVPHLCVPWPDSAWDAVSRVHANEPLTQMWLAARGMQSCKGLPVYFLTASALSPSPPTQE